jgi:hypothetical protein
LKTYIFEKKTTITTNNNNNDTYFHLINLEKEAPNNEGTKIIKPKKTEQHKHSHISRMIMANNSSTSNNLLTGDIKKEILNAVSSSSSSSSLSVSQTVLSSSTSSQSSANTTTSEVKIESVLVSSHTSQQTATKAVSSGNAPIIVNSDSRWIFPLEKIEQSPSRLDGIGKESELSERQEAALFINDLGTKLKV